MSRLIRLHDLQASHPDLVGQEINSIVGKTAYGINNEKIGTVDGALVEQESGRIRYLIVDAGGWFSSKRVVVPVGLAQLNTDGAYFATLTKEQVQAMREYSDTENYELAQQQVQDDTVYASTPTWKEERAKAYTYDSTVQHKDTTAPDRLQLLEERLMVNKERYVAGSVEVSKHVETRQENVNVALQRDEVFLERTPVDARPVDGAVLGGAGQTIRVDLEAERANVGKQAYVVEEVKVGKTTHTENQTFTETVGKEVLDVKENGNLQRNADGTPVVDPTKKG